MPGIVLTFPILSGKVEAWRRFCQQLSNSHLDEFEASRLSLGITRERMALVESAFGASAITIIEAPNVYQALVQIIASQHPFDIWYREQILDLHGINLDWYEKYVHPKKLPANQEVHFEWSRNSHNSKQAVN